MLKRYLIIDLGSCTECMGCAEMAPEVFHYNKETGLVEIIDLADPPLAKIREAIKNCPKDCIFWETYE